MENKRFKPKIDKLFWAIWIPTSVLMIATTCMCAAYPWVLWLLMIPTDIFTFYFLVSPLFGYVELREKSVFIKFGFIIEREIPYSKIRGITKERKIYADSMVSLKNSLDHVNLKYNTFDVVSVSVVENDELIEELRERLGIG